jgi:hypothetical protein
MALFYVLKGDTMKKIILVFCMSFFILIQVSAQKEKLQTAFIYQFTKLIEWCPSYKSGDFVIGVLGSSSISSELASLKGKMVASQSIVIKTLSSVSEIDKCQIVFLPSAKSGQLNSVNSKIGSACTLVITEKPGLGNEGASINFVEEGGKIGFEINKTAFSKHSLIINSKLLTLAKKVYN